MLLVYVRNAHYAYPQRRPLTALEAEADCRHLAMRFHGSLELECPDCKKRWVKCDPAEAIIAGRDEYRLAPPPLLD